MMKHNEEFLRVDTEKDTMRNTGGGVNSLTDARTINHDDPHEDVAELATSSSAAAQN